MAGTVETLKIVINGDNREAVAALQQLNNQLAVFERQLKKATDTKVIVDLRGVLAAKQATLPPTV